MLVRPVLPLTTQEPRGAGRVSWPCWIHEGLGVARPPQPRLPLLPSLTSRMYEGGPEGLRGWI